MRQFLLFTFLLQYFFNNLALAYAVSDSVFQTANNVRFVVNNNGIDEIEFNHDWEINKVTRRDQWKKWKIEAIAPYGDQNAIIIYAVKYNDPSSRYFYTKQSLIDKGAWALTKSQMKELFPENSLFKAMTAIGNDLYILTSDGLWKKKIDGVIEGKIKPDYDWHNVTTLISVGKFLIFHKNDGTLSSIDTNKSIKEMSIKEIGTKWGDTSQLIPIDTVRFLVNSPNFTNLQLKRANSRARNIDINIKPSDISEQRGAPYTDMILIRRNNTISAIRRTNNDPFNKTIKIKTADNVDFKIAFRLINKSITITNLINDIGLDEEIPLPNVKAKEFAKIKEILEILDSKGLLNVSIPLNVASINYLGVLSNFRFTIDSQILEMNPIDLLNLMHAVNFLDIPLLYSITLEKLVMQIYNTNTLLPGIGIGFDRVIGQALARFNNIERRGWHVYHLSSNYTTEIVDAVFSPDGKIIYVSYSDGTIRYWDAIENTLLREVKGADAYGHNLTLSPDGNFLILINRNHHEIKYWNTKTGEQIWKNTLSSGYYIQATFSPDGKTIASVTDSDREIILWDATTGAKISSMQVSVSDYGNILFSPDGNLIAVGSTTGIHFFNVSTGELIKTLYQKGDGGISFRPSLAFSQNGKLLFSSKGGEIDIWDLETNKVTKTIEQESRILQIALSPDGHFIAALGSDMGVASLEIYDTHSAKPISKKSVLGNICKRILFSPVKEMKIASICSDKLWFFQHFDSNNLTLQEVQVLGWVLEKKKLEGKALEIYTDINDKFPGLVKSISK